MPVVRVVPLTPVAHESRAFQAAGRVGVTVIVKVDYALVADGVARRTAIASFAPDDLAPYRPFADVVFRGHAHAPGNKPVAAMAVRLSLLRGRQALLDKRLIVSGDRLQAPNQPAPAAMPFVDMPIVWERALGGGGFELNPVGIGAVPDASGAWALPNVAYPGPEMQHRPACFAPLSADAPARLRFLGAQRDEVVNRAVPDLSDPVRYGYYQVAPPDQQIAFLRGDETIRLEGLTRGAPLFSTRLPGEVALARAYVPPLRGTPLELVADGLEIDGEALTASVTWRGCFTALDLDMVRQMIIAIAIQPADRPVAAMQWPTPGAIETFFAAMNPPAREAERTMELSLPAQAAAAHTATVPFTGAAPEGARRETPSEPPASIPGSPWATRPSLNPVMPTTATEITATIELDHLSPETRRALVPGSSDFSVGVPKSEPAPPRSAHRKASQDPWAKVADVMPVVVEAKPPPPKLPEKPSARAMLYQRMTKK